MPRCPKPEKVPYLTQLDAEDERLHINACNGTAQRLSRAYECRCGYWHLTKWEYVAPKGRQRTRHLTVAPEPVSYLPTDPWTSERETRAKELQKANLGERARERLEHPWPWPRRSEAA